MSNNNMINPANYYNPFAKYNYVSKTRGVYIPKDTTPILSPNNPGAKSANIYSPDYDPETDLNQQLEQEINFSGIFNFLNIFTKNK